MIKISAKFLLFFSISFSLFAEYNKIKWEYEYLIRSGFRQNENKIATTHEILNLAGIIAKANNIDFLIEYQINDRTKEEYPVMKLLPSSDSVAGQEVAKMDNDFGGLSLVLSPYDLKRSKANAFFVPDGSQIGVPYNFIYNEISESYLHEKLHANSFKNLILSGEDTYVGHYKLLEGQRMSLKVFDGYTRFASLDEMLATKLSADTNINALYDLYIKSTPKEFLRDRQNEDLLSQIKFNLETLIALSLQNQDLLKQAIEKIKANKFTLESSQISLGIRLSKEIYKFETLVNSVKSSFENGRSFSAFIPNGTKIQLLSSSKSPEKLIKRLQTIIFNSKEIEDKYKHSLKLIGLRIMYADLANVYIYLQSPWN